MVGKHDAWHEGCIQIAVNKPWLVNLFVSTTFCCVNQIQDTDNCGYWGGGGHFRILNQGWISILDSSHSESFHLICGMLACFKTCPQPSSWNCRVKGNASASSKGAWNGTWGTGAATFKVGLPGTTKNPVAL